ncbi:bifunctional adenosylcobinamide kinase/adenosylcobinamide-phosphate guanylyltransferase [Primorskyibacter flagellatus]|nr:bifunctional adenosylcobinamide kinase/adenosylcobinamide-phosphate guanylyltransferase [Primorskyibacter flagellatus]
MAAPVTLVLGGAASGKSAFAENAILSAGGRPYYIATAQAFDAEMTEKIARHVERRGARWTTREAPTDLSGALRQVNADHAVLIDCLTLWLTNLMLAEQDVDAATTDLMKALDHCPAPVWLVSNEVGSGIVPDTALGRRFREAQGRLNIVMAARADRVVQVVAGLPNVLKGTLA